ncbi:MAG: family 43 glycosylhydrolase, partial [Clostridia bacterium]|nr:family 43 glycosylhydrolase [Clostridia bacterium]
AQENAYFTNPVIPSDVADPSLIRVGNDYYATGTSSEWAPHYPIFHSTDLVNWKHVLIDHGGDRGIGRPVDLRHALGRVAAEARHHAADGSGVGADEDGLPPMAGGDLVKRLLDPGGELGHALTPRGAGKADVRLPKGAVGGKATGDLIKGHALPLPRKDLTEAPVGDDGEAVLPRGGQDGVHSAAEVTRIDGIEVDGTQADGQGRGLALPKLGKPEVGIAEKGLGEVALTLTVTDDKKRGLHSLLPSFFVLYCTACPPFCQGAVRFFLFFSVSSFHFDAFML